MLTPEQESDQSHVTVGVGVVLVTAAFVIALAGLVVALSRPPAPPRWEPATPGHEPQPVPATGTISRELDGEDDK